MANEIELNGLADTNNLPDDWKISLINPVTLQPAQNITVARFLELLTEKMPEATKESKGLISNLGFSSLITFKGLWSKNNVDLLTENGTWMNGGGENMTSEIMGWGLLCVIRANFYIVQISVAPEAIRFRYSGDGGKSWADPVILNKNRTYSAMVNVLTDTIPVSPVLESRQVRPTCLPNHLYQTRYRSSTFGLSTKLERQYLNCRKKINVLNKSSRLTA